MLKTVSYTVITRFTVLFISTLSLALSAKWYGPEGRGYIAGATTMASLMATIGGLSIGRVLIFEMTRLKLSPQEYLRRNLCSLILIALSLTAVIYLGALIIAYAHPTFFGKVDRSFYLIAFMAVPALVWSGQSLYVFSALGRLPTQNTVNIAVQAIYLSCAGLAVLHFKAGLFWFLMLMTFSSLAVAACELFYLFRFLHPEKVIHSKEVTALIRNGVKIHVDTIGGILITSANILILNYYLAPREVGIYQLAAQMVSVIVIVPTVVALNFNHEIATLGHDTALQKQAVYYFAVMALVALTCGAAYFLVPYAVAILASDKFQNAIGIFRLLLLSVVGNAFCVLMGPQLSARGYFKYLSVSTLVFGCAGVVLSVTLVKRFGMTGAAYATIILYTAAMVGNIIFYWYLRNRAAGNNVMRMPENEVVLS